MTNLKKVFNYGRENVEELLRIVVVFTILTTILMISGCKKQEESGGTPEAQVSTEVQKETTVEETMATEETEPVEDARETFSASNIEEAIEVLEAEAKLKELTIIVFDDTKNECYVLEDGDAYTKKNTDRIFAYCRVEEFRHGVSTDKHIVESYTWNDSHDVVEFFFTDFEGVAPLFFKQVKDGQTINNKKIGILLDKTIYETKVAEPTGRSYNEWLKTTKNKDFSPLINWNEELGIGTFLADGDSIYLADVKQLVFTSNYGTYHDLEIVNTEILTIGDFFAEYSYQELTLDKSKIIGNTEVTINYGVLGTVETITFSIIP